MANLGIEIKRKCPICGKVFIIKTLDSVYCSPKCSKVANKRKKDKEKKEALFVTYAQNVPDIREYLTVRQVVAIYGVERSTLYRLAKLGKIPCINLGTRLMRFKRSELDLLFHGICKRQKSFHKRSSQQQAKSQSFEVLNISLFLSLLVVTVNA
ncbi:MAG: helix-turn-helix domain-containing protein [Prevotella sp.]|nr:helix-turn-helix domain-containing protein [Prevotella sp.]